ncbi:hypothetical protein [Paenibacillus lautus]|uniref:hypothetical protein n=1 Tax=Paenibacillus lautus TaxID=1401 RepID=UPI00398636C1
MVTKYLWMRSVYRGQAIETTLSSIVSPLMNSSLTTSFRSMERNIKILEIEQYKTSNDVYIQLKPDHIFAKVFLAV